MSPSEIVALAHEMKHASLEYISLEQQVVVPNDKGVDQAFKIISLCEHLIKIYPVSDTPVRV